MGQEETSTPPFRAHHASGQNESAPETGALPKIQTGKSLCAAILVGFTSRTLLVFAIGMARGFIASGISLHEVDV